MIQSNGREGEGGMGSASWGGVVVREALSEGVTLWPRRIQSCRSRDGGQSMC